MRETWRWFGPNDPIDLLAVKQTGADGVVSALYEKRAGEVWAFDEILAHKSMISAAGLTWDVCESIWMPDAIKIHGAGATAHMSAWIDSMVNLGRAGVNTICYNFMPVVDWTRTDLAYPVAGRGNALRFDMIDFIAYDCFVLERKHATSDYETDLVDRAKARFDALSPDDIQRLEHNIIAGLPGGADGFSRDQILNRIDQFHGLSADDLSANLKSFLDTVIPVAQEYGVNLCIHPDDPPIPLFGIPRIVSTQDDLSKILAMNDSVANGITFCTGSLGSRGDNDLLTMIARFSDRIHFAHLRNVERQSDSSFYESEHLSGSVDMIAIVQQLLKSNRNIPLRPDHGHLLAYESNHDVNAGYSYLGRLKGLAELRGVIAAMEHQK
ncbi:UNVERIFIED_CONTAM: hypothetical protein GTU68_030024 [Idotea baltica]|nr:hypothetical protein [Idotea baltica]